MKRNTLRLITLSLIAFSLTISADEKVAINVTTGALSDHVFHPEYSAPATALALNESSISAETSGALISLPALVGQQLKKGALIAELDCQDNLLRLDKSQAALLSINARVTLAQRQIKRSKSLLKSRNVSEERLNQQQADLKTALADQKSQYATIKESKLAIQRCKIVAPFTGIVTERLVGEGQWLTPGKAVVRLIDSERIEISAQLSSDIAETLAQAKNIKLESNQGTFDVALARLVPVIKSRGRNREARLSFTETKRALPGTTGRLVWQTFTAYIAADLPVSRENSLGVFIADGGKARFHPLPDALEGQPTLVQLPAGTQLILEGRHALNDGDSISVKQ